MIFSLKNLGFLTVGRMACCILLQMRRRNVKPSTELLLNFWLENEEENFNVERKSAKFSKFSILATGKNSNIPYSFEVEHNKNLLHH